VTIEAEYRKIAYIVVLRVFIEVMNLHRFALDPADATGSVRYEKNSCCHIWLDQILVLFRSHEWSEF
jgi:hypothetical protein